MPRTGTTLRLAANADALVPVDLAPGRPLRIVVTREESGVAERLADGTLRLANGTTSQSRALRDWGQPPLKAPPARLKPLKHEGYRDWE